jgi:hypothetical protein
MPSRSIGKKFCSTGPNHLQASPIFTHLEVIHLTVRWGPKSSLDNTVRIPSTQIPFFTCFKIIYLKVYLFIFNLFNGVFSVTHTTWCRMKGWQMNWKGYERKRLWHNFEGIVNVSVWRCWGKPRSLSGKPVSWPRFVSGTSLIGNRSFNYSTRTFGIKGVARDEALPRNQLLSKSRKFHVTNSYLKIEKLLYSL